MKLITLHIPETYIKDLDQLVDDQYYPNRAEAIRIAIRDLLNDEVWRKKEKMWGKTRIFTIIFLILQNWIKYG